MIQIISIPTYRSEGICSLLARLLRLLVTVVLAFQSISIYVARRRNHEYKNHPDPQCC
jgi:hypothetical protein